MRSPVPHPLRNRRPAALTVFAPIVAVLLAACGGTLSDEEVLAAGAVTTPVGPAAGGGSGPVPGADGAVAGPAAATGTEGATVGQPGAVVGPGGAPTAGPEGATAGGGGDGAAAAAPSTPGETGPIVVASVGNYSGPAGAAQAGIPRGVQVWAASVNAAGGLFGREVQVIVVDDGGDPARYASAVRDLVENRGVVAFVGNGASLSMPGGTAYLESAGVPVIGSDCSVHDWFRSSVYFPQCPTFSSHLESIVRAGVRVTGRTQMGFVACLESAACRGDGGELEAGAAASGAEIVYTGQISLTQIDFTAECRNAQSAGVDLMFVGADPNTLARFARSCERQGFTPKYVQASISVNAESVTLPGLSDVVVALPVFPFQGGSGPAIDAFSSAMGLYGGGVPGPAEAYGWASGKLFEAIATRAAATAQSLQPATLLAAAHTVEGETLGGLTVPLTFTGATPTPANCYFVVQGDGAGGWSAPLGSEAIC